MTAERLRQVEELYHAAREDRAVLEKADPELRREVESLLAQDGVAGPMEQPLLEVVAKLLAGDSTLTQVAIGAQLGRYRIEALIGAGGMGEVYRAADTRLDRKVAIKVSARQFSGRFEREARAIAALNHPNICTLHDVGPNYLVMELIEGPTLAERIKQGPVLLEEALAIAKQIAEALRAAHEKGVVHRDLKPGNVKIRPDGTVKVLDFGLAKIASASTNDSPPEDTATLTTRAGMVMGTAAYMSPEQAQGKPVDQRADIWAFGAVLYEMLTGRRLFQGETVSDTLGAVLTKEPEWELAPTQVQPLLKRCLEKDPQKRLRDISGTGLLLEETPQPAGPRRIRTPWKRFFVIGGAISTLAVAAVSLFTLRSPKKTLLEQVQWQQLTDFSDSATDPALSPDGRMLAFKRGGVWFMDPGQIYVKLLPDGVPAQLTHDSFSKMAPVFSPDGTRVAYSITRPDSEDFEIWEASLLPGGGEPRAMLRNAEGLTWIDKQHVLFSETREPPRLAVVTSTESRTASRDVYVPENPRWMAHFSALSPDRRQVLIVEMQPEPGGNFPWLPCRLAPFDGSFKGRQVGPVPGHCIAAAWSPDGKWMYFSARVNDKFHLWRQRREGGEPEQITSGPTEEEGLAISSDGRSAITSVGVNQFSVWVHDANGERQISGEGDAFAPRFAPDGKKVYYDSQSDLWVTDLASGHAERVLPGVAVSGGVAIPGYALSPDGRAIAYTTADGGLWYASLDRRTPPHILAPQGDRPEFSRSGDILFRDPRNRVLYRVNPDGTALRVVPRARSRFVEGRSAPLSPDEQWETRLADDGGVIAYPRGENHAIPLCVAVNCTVGWASDGKFFWISLPPLSGQKAVTGLFPLKGKSMLPTLPPKGVRVEADLMKIPGVQLVDSPAISPAPGGASYAFVHLESRWNLYRVPLP